MFSLARPLRPRCLGTAGTRVGERNAILFPSTRPRFIGWACESNRQEMDFKSGGDSFNYVPIMFTMKNVAQGEGQMSEA